VSFFFFLRRQIPWTYNQTVTHLNSPETKGRQSIKEVRALCVNNEANRPAWAKSVPYDVRDEGTRGPQPLKHSMNGLVAGAFHREHAPR
jgi:hypothetical protein